ncbi:MAG: hypothetical protein K8L99_26025 [Anaerolineae bacterium]|nr:hypothetical protein [Anaerolineae bacterium]
MDVTIYEQRIRRVTEIGAAKVYKQPDQLVLTTQPTGSDSYADAQISDYVEVNFRWQPPLRLVVRAYAMPAADQLRGTAGFGFWNQPFMPGQVSLRLPQAVWFFFSSPPSNIHLAQDVPGPGWKAATIHAARWPFLALAPTAPIGLLLMRVPALYRWLWPVGQRAIGVSEHLLDGALLAEPHTYTLDWRTDGATFTVDDKVVLEAPIAPRGPLGFIAWVDTQYAVVTPQGQFGFGLLDVAHEQSLVLEHIEITKR